MRRAGVASNAHPAFEWHANKRHCACCLSGGGETRKLAARARRRAALVVIGLRDMKGYRTPKGLSLLAKCRGATCELWPPTRTRHSRGTRTSANALAVSREVGNTRACRACAPCRAGCDRRSHHERVLHRQKASLFRRKAVVRYESYGFRRAPGIRVAREQAPMRWLSLGRWRSTRACRARAPCRASCDRPTYYRRILQWQKASLSRRKTVVRRASRGIQHAPGIRVAHEQAALRELSFGRWRKM